MRDNSTDRRVSQHTWWPAFIPQYSGGESRRLSEVHSYLHTGTHTRTHAHTYFVCKKKLKRAECSCRLYTTINISLDKDIWYLRSIMENKEQLWSTVPIPNSRATSTGCEARWHLRYLGRPAGPLYSLASSVPPWSTALSSPSLMVRFHNALVSIWKYSHLKLLGIAPHSRKSLMHR